MVTVNLQPLLEGPTLLLRPLVPDDFEELYSVAADPLIWQMHPEPTRWQRHVFRRFFDSALAGNAAFVVIDRQTRQMIGSSRYYDHDAAARAIAIGYTFLARSHWGGTANREMKSLMLRHIRPAVDVVWFHIGTGNLRSRKAIEKLGGILSHEGLRDGLPYCWYRIETHHCQ